MFSRKIAYCPVCPKAEGELGYYTPGMSRSFVCTDCQFIYRWDSNDHLEPPIRYFPPKKVQKCMCASCQVRDGFID